MDLIMGPASMQETPLSYNAQPASRTAICNINEAIASRPLTYRVWLPGPSLAGTRQPQYILLCNFV